MSELAWRRRARERAAIEQTERRHDELLRAILTAAVLSSPRKAILDGRYVETQDELAVYVGAVLKGCQR